MNHLIKVLCLILIGLALHPAAWASGMREQMDSMFNGMSNYTRPGVYETQSRGVITGGAFSARTRSADISLFSFSPPSLNAGCGGIDAYMGSFSWISEEQLIDLAKAIASDAAGYAFEVALSSICPTCASTMDKLRNYINKLNSQLGNSCQMAKMLVDRTTTNGQWEGMRWDALDSGAQQGSSWLDNYSDEFDASQNAQNRGEDLSRDDPTIVNRNPLVDVILKQDFARWFRGTRSPESNDEFGMDVLSLFGMTAFCTPFEGGLPECPMWDENDIGHMRELDYPPTIDLATLVFGTDSPYSVEVDAEVYRCDGPLCLNPYLVSYEDIGFAARIIEAYLGSDGSPGIIQKLAARDGAPLTPEERSIVTRSGDITAITRNLLLTSPEKARGFIETWAPVMAVEIMHGFAQEAYRGLVSGLRSTPGVGNEIVVARLRDRMLELEYERARLAGLASTNTTAMLEHYELMKRTLVDAPNLGTIATPTASSSMATPRGPGAP